jgi:Cof subfamily protein (haloacid dehalogenase superfamily)
MATRPEISLVLTDVDGTLVTEDKVLTERAQRAVESLRAADIRFAIVSGRPPRGMGMLFEPLCLDTPIAGFNGGLFVNRDLSVLERNTLPRAIAGEAIELIREHGLDPWVYNGNDWLITRLDAPHVEREAWTVRFEPEVTADLASALDQVVKIVGVSDDLEAVERCEKAARAALGTRASASRSQPYYVDVTHPKANKGAVVDYLSRELAIPTSAIATIGDGANDVQMFRESGLSIAMGNASDAVKAAATAVTDSYEDEGFAKAIERFIVGAGDPAEESRP